MPLLGLMALLWFLIRVIPKPSRAAYPCQRAAFPIASAFVLWVVGTIASTRLALRLRRRYHWPVPVVIVIFLLLSGLTSLVFQPADLLLADTFNTTSFTPSDNPNEPVGTARGIFPGRVTWVHNPESVLFDGSTGKYWQADKVDQAALDDMFSRALTMLTGHSTEADAWDAAFRYFNEAKGFGDAGYSSGEKIAIKINMNTANSHTDTDAAMNTTPHAAMALSKQLVEHAGVPENMISFYEVSRPIPGYVYDMVHATYPGIIFVDRDGGNGRLKYQKDADCEVAWSQDLTLENGGGHPTFLPKVVSEAKYIINLANLKGHDLAGQSLCAKNQVGSIISENPDKLSLSDPRSAGIHPYIAVHDFAYWSLPKRDMATYNTLVDLMGHKDIGEKTLLFIIDGLYATQVQHSNVNSSMKWTSSPFNNQFTSSVFMSFDGMAIESVGLDFTRNESTLTQVYGNVDNYLHEAAQANDPPSEINYDPEQDGSSLPSLGVHEHWNNETDRKYTRNLDSGEGIELISYRVREGLPSVPEQLSCAYDEENDIIAIAWKDVSDNETGFVIERKSDGASSFSEIARTEIDRVAFNDDSFNAEGSIEYRIKATGESGDSEYAEVAVVNFESAGAAYLSATEISIYPNPASNAIRLNKEVTHLKILDASGKVCLQNDQVMSGELIDVKVLPSGLYILTAIHDDHLCTGKLYIR